jgi:hypothetical protein
VLSPHSDRSEHWKIAEATALFKSACAGTDEAIYVTGNPAAYSEAPERNLKYYLYAYARDCPKSIEF